MKQLELPTAKDTLCQAWSNWPYWSEEYENVKVLQMEKQIDKMKASIFKVNWGPLTFWLFLHSIHDWTFTFFCNNVF